MSSPLSSQLITPTPVEMISLDESLADHTQLPESDTDSDGPLPVLAVNQSTEDNRLVTSPTIEAVLNDIDDAFMQRPVRGVGSMGGSGRNDVVTEPTNEDMGENNETEDSTGLNYLGAQAEGDGEVGPDDGNVVATDAQHISGQPLENEDGSTGSEQVEQAIPTDVKPQIDANAELEVMPAASDGQARSTGIASTDEKGDDNTGAELPTHPVILDLQSPDAQVENEQADGVQVEARDANAVGPSMDGQEDSNGVDLATGDGNHNNEPPTTSVNLNIEQAKSQDLPIVDHDIDQTVHPETQTTQLNLTARKDLKEAMVQVDNSAINKEVNSGQKNDPQNTTTPQVTANDDSDPPPVPPRRNKPRGGRPIAPRRQISVRNMAPLPPRPTSEESTEPRAALPQSSTNEGKPNPRSDNLRERNEVLWQTLDDLQRECNKAMGEMERVKGRQRALERSTDNTLAALQENFNFLADPILECYKTLTVIRMALDDLKYRPEIQKEALMRYEAKYRAAMITLRGWEGFRREAQEKIEVNSAVAERFMRERRRALGFLATCDEGRRVLENVRRYMYKFNQQKYGTEPRIVG